jgi:hypothetical protein
MIGVDQFPILSPQQADPLLTGLQAGQQAYNQFQQNRYIGPMLAQQLQQARLQNAAQQTKNQYLSPQLQANIGLTQAQTAAQNALPDLYGAQAQESRARGGYFGAEAGLTDAQRSLLQQQTPYLVQQQEGGVYKDPILQRLFEAGQAQNTGAISPDMLGSIGLGGQGSQSGMPTGTTPLQNQLQQLGQGGVTSPGAFSNPTQNWAVFGSPISPLAMMQLQAYGKGLDTTATTGVTQYNQMQDQAAQNSDDANSLMNYLNEFKTSYDKSFYKGPARGTAPSSGALSAFVPGDLTNEQEADQAAANMQMIMARMMKSSKFTNSQLKFAGTLKLNRTNTPDAVNDLQPILSSISGRAKEYQDFLNYSRNNNIPVQTANTLWQQYQSQRPAFDANSKTANNQYQGTWKDYATPQAVQATNAGAPYVPNANKISKQDLKYLTPQQLQYVKSVQSMVSQ